MVKNAEGQEVFKNVTTGTSDTLGKGKTDYARDYYGAHLQLNLDYRVNNKFSATTLLRGEFVTGTQPGSLSSSSVPLGTGTAIPTTGGISGVDLYIRKFTGVAAYFTQSFHNTVDNQTIQQDITFRYDLYNPNTQVSATGLNKVNGFSTTDLTYNTFGFGYTICPVPYFKLMLWYDHVVNEGTNLAGWSTDYKKDDVFTLRTQFTIDSWWFNKRPVNSDNLITRLY